MLDLLPATAKQIEEKLDVLSLWGTILGIIKGFTAPEVEQALNAARQLCHLVDNPAKHFTVVRGLRGYWGQRCGWAIVAELNQEIHALAQKTENPLHLQEALHSTAASAFHQGRFAEALTHFEHAIALYQLGQDSGVIDDAQDHAFTSLYRVAGTLWLLGYPDQAERRMEEVAAVAR